VPSFPGQWPLPLGLYRRHPFHALRSLVRCAPGLSALITRPLAEDDHHENRSRGWLEHPQAVSLDTQWLLLIAGILETRLPRGESLGPCPPSAASSHTPFAPPPTQPRDREPP